MILQITSVMKTQLDTKLTYGRTQIGKIHSLNQSQMWTLDPFLYNAISTTQQILSSFKSLEFPSKSKKKTIPPYLQKLASKALESKKNVTNILFINILFIIASTHNM